LVVLLQILGVSGTKIDCVSESTGKQSGRKQDPRLQTASEELAQRPLFNKE